MNYGTREVTSNTSTPGDSRKCRLEGETTLAQSFTFDRTECVANVAILYEPLVVLVNVILRMCKDPNDDDASFFIRLKYA